MKKIKRAINTFGLMTLAFWCLCGEQILFERYAWKEQLLQCHYCQRWWKIGKKERKVTLW